MKISVPLKILKMDGKGCHLFVNVKFNSKIKGKLIIDTGATKTVFDSTLLNGIVKDVHQPEELKSAGIDATMIESRMGAVDSFKMGKLKLKNFQVVLLNMDNINQLYENVYKIKIWGLIGGDFLLEHNVVIDYKRKKLIIKI
jgi:hypothetical protein